MKQEDEWERKVHDFWDDVILDTDGQINHDQVYKELGDYLHMLEQVPDVYYHITCGAMSKPNYYARDVIGVAGECADREIRAIVNYVLDKIEDGESIGNLRGEFPNPDKR